jgi:succinate dehydrogenase / fumarate reductase, cytochrome b subunit
MWVLTAYRSTIGKKAIMAVTGLLLVAFVIGHMAGNLQVFIGAARMNAYAAFLQGLGELLWLVRIVLFVALVLHVLMAWQLTQIKRQARPVGYQQRDPQVSTVASRTMRWGGVLILVFIVFHILHFTTGTVFPMASRADALYPAWTHTDVYGNVIAAFRVPWVVAFYLVAMLFLLLHLFHGAWASVRTLGFVKPSDHPRRRHVATAIALVVWLGFSVVPVAVFLGLVR